MAKIKNLLLHIILNLFFIQQFVSGVINDIREKTVKKFHVDLSKNQESLSTHFLGDDLVDIVDFSVDFSPPLHTGVSLGAILADVSIETISLGVDLFLGVAVHTGAAESFLRCLLLANDHHDRLQFIVVLLPVRHYCSILLGFPTSSLKNGQRKNIVITRKQPKSIQK